MNEDKKINLIKMDGSEDIPGFDPGPILEIIKNSIGGKNFILVIHDDETSDVRQYSNLHPTHQAQLLEVVTKGTVIFSEKTKPENLN